jgi:hypothetical protein
MWCAHDSSVELALGLLATKITQLRFNLHSPCHEIDSFHQIFATLCHLDVMRSALLAIIINCWSMCRLAVPTISQPCSRIGSHSEVTTMLTAKQANHEIDQFSPLISGFAN